MRTFLDPDNRRRLLFLMDFDTRSFILNQEIEESWPEDSKELWIGNKRKLEDELRMIYGSFDLEAKIERFKEAGVIPFSIVHYHNEYFRQVRDAFVTGNIYPSLVGACGLGERILNHLVMDLKKYFVHKSTYRQVHNKDSVDDWSKALRILDDWEVLFLRARSSFEALMRIRHRSVHFNRSTYGSLKGDCIQAIQCLRNIIEDQFGGHGPHPWVIPGTSGHSFIKKSWESHPLIVEYFARQCPLVGPHFGMSLARDGRWLYYDFEQYDFNIKSDEEFARLFNERAPEQVAGPA